MHVEEHREKLEAQAKEAFGKKYEDAEFAGQVDSMAKAKVSEELQKQWQRLKDELREEMTKEVDARAEENFKAKLIEQREKK